MTKQRLYHGLAVFLVLSAALAVPDGEAVEQKQVKDVWPLGQRQRYVYFINGENAGDSWVTVEQMPRTQDRFLMTNVIKVDGVPFGGRMKVEGQSVAELDAWGRPLAYDLELTRPAGKTTMNVVMNYPFAEMTIVQPDSTRQESPRYNEDSRLLDFVFVGPWDLAFLLDPMNPSATKARRNYFVPQLEVNVLTDFVVAGEETLSLLDGTEVPTVRVDVVSLLTNVWLDPKGRVVKAEVPSEKLVVQIAEVQPPPTAGKR